MIMFVYVFSTNDRDYLLSKNYNLLKSDTRNNIYIFENSNHINFEETNVKFVFSDVLTF